jgi:hypothetical protein
MTAKCSCIISSKIKKHWSWGIEYLHRNEKKMKNTYLSQSYESFRMLFFTKYTFIFFLRFISNKKKHFFSVQSMKHIKSNEETKLKTTNYSNSFCTEEKNIYKKLEWTFYVNESFHHIIFREKNKTIQYLIKKDHRREK